MIGKELRKYMEEETFSMKEHLIAPYHVDPTPVVQLDLQELVRRLGFSYFLLYDRLASSVHFSLPTCIRVRHASRQAFFRHVSTSPVYLDSLPFLKTEPQGPVPYSQPFI